MDDLLKSLKEQLSTIIEEIDDYLPTKSEDIIIKKPDFKYLYHLSRLVNDYHVFEYKEGIKFALRSNTSYGYECEIFTTIMDGSLEVLILNKRDDLEENGHVINYKLETKIRTNLRNLYRPIKEED